MALPVGTILEVTYRGTILGQTFMSVFHTYVFGQSTTPNDFTELSNILGYYTDAGVGSVRPAYSAATTQAAVLTSASIQAVAPTRMRRVTQPLNSIPGLRADTQVPNVQASLSFKTNFARRRDRGGMRLPASPDDAATGVWIGNYTTSLQALADLLIVSLIEPGGDGLYQPCIYHRDLQPPANRTDITAVIVEPTTRVIRRRTVGLGI